MMALDGEGRPAPGAGQATVQILGTLTLRGGARPTTWGGTGEVRGSTVRLRARTAFAFADFERTQPCVVRVLGIRDPIRLAVDRTPRPAS